MSSGATKDGTAYELAGEQGRSVVVLIHGLGLSKDLWRSYVPVFSQYYQVLSYDLYGHGESAPAPTKASLSVFSSQLADLMEHLGIDRAAIVGFSIGGMINRRFAMDYPQKVSALAILNSPHDRGPHAQRAVEERALKVANEGASATLDDALKRWFTVDFLDSSHAALDEVRAWRHQVDTRSYAQTAWVLANGVVELTESSLNLKVPSLILTCENDVGSTPAMSEAIQAQIAGAELKIIPQLQHLGMMEQPHLFLTILIDFLKRAMG